MPGLRNTLHTTTAPQIIRQTAPSISQPVRRMSRFPPLLLACLLMPIASCKLFGPDSDDEFSSALLIPSCGPTDGPALDIYLASGEHQVTCSRLPHVPFGQPPEESFISIKLLGIDEPEKGIFELGDGSESTPPYQEGGQAHRCVAREACTRSERGTVIMGAAAEDGRVPITINIRFEDGERVAGSFVAEQCERWMMCG